MHTIIIAPYLWWKFCRCRHGGRWLGRRRLGHEIGLSDLRSVNEGSIVLSNAMIDLGGLICLGGFIPRQQVTMNVSRDVDTTRGGRQMWCSGGILHGRRGCSVAMIELAYVVAVHLDRRLQKVDFIFRRRSFLSDRPRRRLYVASFFSRPNKKGSRAIKQSAAQSSDISFKIKLLLYLHFL